MSPEEIKQQNNRWLLLGLFLLAFFVLSLIISFNDGYKQGISNVICNKSLINNFGGFYEI